MYIVYIIIFVLCIKILCNFVRNNGLVKNLIRNQLYVPSPLLGGLFELKIMLYVCHSFVHVYAFCPIVYAQTVLKILDFCCRGAGEMVTPTSIIKLSEYIEIKLASLECMYETLRQNIFHRPPPSGFIKNCRCQVLIYIFSNIRVYSYRYTCIKIFFIRFLKNPKN